MKQISRQWAERGFIGILLAVAAGLGLYARFKGLGTWALAADEYYIARSVQNLRESGWPEFLCGGYYVRGLTYQYLLAGLSWTGWSAEFAGRLVTVLCSLAALPAVYLLGSRVQGRAVGIIAVGLLLVSVWEVEMGRFARMYAPFQTAFLWYLWFFVRHTVDRDSRTLWPMLMLSVVGVLTWEGGAVLGLINLLPPFFRYAASGSLSRRDWGYLAGTGVLAVFLLLYTQVDLRRLGDPLPPDVIWALPGVRHVSAPWTTLTSHPLWLLLALVPLAVTAWAVPWLTGFRNRWPVAAGLGLALLAGVLHQFALSACALLMVLLLGLVHWRELVSGHAWRYFAALGAWAGYWSAFAVSTVEWRGGIEMGPQQLVRSVIARFIELPDLLENVVGPWAGAVPVLSAGLLVLLVVAALGLLASRERPLNDERVQLTLIFCLAVVASSGVAPRPETRYLFAVYPLAIILGVVVIFRLVAKAGGAMPVAAGTAAITATGFLLADDFSIHHLTRVDSPEINFRLGMNEARKSHFYPRTDLKGIAAALEGMVRPDDLVITNVTGLDFYFPRINLVYVDENNLAKLRDWSCDRGTRDRWTNHPLIYWRTRLVSELERASRTVLVLDAGLYARLSDRLGHLAPVVAYRSIGEDVVVAVVAGKQPAPEMTGVRITP